MSDSESPQGPPASSDLSGSTAFHSLGMAQLRAQIEHAPVGMFYINEREHWIYRNLALTRLMGLPDFQQPYDMPSIIRGGGYDEGYSVAYERAAANRQPLDIETYFRPPNGQLIWVLLRAIPQFDESGALVSWIGAVTDISERKRLQDMAAQEQRQLIRLSNALGAATSEHFFATLVRALAESLPADLVIVHTSIDKPRPHFRTLAGVLHGEPVPSYSLLLTAGYGNRLQSEDLVCEDLDQLGPDVSPVRFEGMKCLVARSIRSFDGRLLGVIQARHHTSMDTVRAAQLMDMFAVRAAAEMERERDQRLLAMQRENLRWVNELSVRIHDKTSLDDIGREAVRAIASHTSAPLVSISLYDDHPTTPVTILASNWRSPLQQGRLARIALLDELLDASDGVVLVTDIAKQLAREPNFVAHCEHDGIRELVLIKLHHGGRELGALVFQYLKPGYVEELDPEILRALGKMLSLAISNTQHFLDLEYRASHDSLTGLRNRSVLHGRFATEVDTSNAAALLLLDLDRFKEINDTLGHNVGDDVLRQTAARLSDELSGRRALLCRLGGDEFAVLVTDETLDGAHALTLGHELLASLQKPFPVGGITLDIGASIGVALYPLHGTTSHALLRSADVAMYTAKRERSGVRLYDPQLDTHSLEHLRLMADIGGGIRRGELQLHYQPKLDLHLQRVVACEALVRWNHPERGVLGPDQFIPLIEMTEVIHSLTARVIEDACRQQQSWRRQGLHLTVAVNLSARNLLDDRIVEHVERVLGDYAVPANALELEITETALMQDPRRAGLLLDRLAELGVRLAVDDFGTGYSSLAYLRRLPLKSLKIDRMFICEMLEKSQDIVIVQSIISLAHNLDLEVVAEGVETAEVLSSLSVLGCDEIQGYHLSRPLSPDEFLCWMRAREVLSATS